MEKILFAFMGCVGIFLTIWYFANGHYIAAAVAAVCTGIEFWGAFRKDDGDE